MASGSGTVSVQVATVTVDARVGDVGNVAVMRAMVGGLGRVVMLVTVVGESVLDLVDDVRHDG